jgi:hypothetical protein
MFLDYLYTSSPLLPWIIKGTLYTFKKCVTVNQECPIYASCHKTTIVVQCNAEKTKGLLNMLAKNRPFKS